MFADSVEQEPITNVISKLNGLLWNHSDKDVFEGLARFVETGSNYKHLMDAIRKLRTAKRPTRRTARMSTTYIPIKRKFTKSRYPRPGPINKDNEYAVEEILDYKDGKYQVLWEGYPRREATWEPLENLATCQDLVKAFEERSQEQVDWQDL